MNTNTDLDPEQFRARRIELMQQALSATQEVRAMIDLTEIDFEGRWPTMKGTETGQFLLEYTRPHCIALEKEIRESVEWLAAGGESEGDAQRVADGAEKQIAIVRELLVRVHAEIAASYGEN